MKMQWTFYRNLDLFKFLFIYLYIYSFIRPFIHYKFICLLSNRSFIHFCVYQLCPFYRTLDEPKMLLRHFLVTSSILLSKYIYDCFFVCQIVDRFVVALMFPVNVQQSKTALAMRIVYCIWVSCWGHRPSASEARDILLPTSTNWRYWIEFNKTVTRNEGVHPSVVPVWLRSNVTPDFKECQVLSTYKAWQSGSDASRP
jgi:hypothetical protein